MDHKVTQITRCSNAEEELKKYAEEADPPSECSSAHLPQKFLGWNQAQLIDLKNAPYLQSNVKKRRLSVMVRGKIAFLEHGYQQKGYKQQLKFKLRQYKEQVLQPSCILDVSNEFTIANTSNQDHKQNFESNSKTNDFSKNKKQRNFSISQPKHKSTNSDVSFQTLMSKTSRTLVNTKQRASRPAKMSFFPINADFCLYEEEQKLSLKIKQYIKKCSLRLDF